MAELSLVLDATPARAGGLARWIAGLGGVTAVLAPTLSGLHRADLGCAVFSERDLVPLGGPREEELYAEAARARDALIGRLGAVRLAGVPLVEDLAAHLGKDDATLRVLLEAALLLAGRAFDRVVIALESHSVFHLALLDAARRLGLAPADATPWVAGDDGVTRAAPETPLDLDAVLAGIARAPRTGFETRERRRLALEEKAGGVLVLLPSAQAHFTRNLAPVVRELARRAVPSAVFAHDAAVQAAFARVGVPTGLWLPPEDALPDDPEWLAEAVGSFARALARDLAARAPGFAEELDARVLCPDGLWGLARAAQEIERLEGALSAMQPRAVYLAPSGSYLEHAARRLAARHGALSATSVFFSIVATARSFSSYSAERITLLGEAQVETFRARGCRPEQLVTAGQPELDDALAAWDAPASLAHLRTQVPSFDPSRKMVLVATATLDPAGELVWTAALGRWARGAGVQAIVKLHPSIPADPFHELIRRDPELALTVVEDRELWPYLRLADAVITDASHAGGLAVCLGKPLLVVNTTGQPWPYNRFDEAGVALIACTAEEVGPQLARLLGGDLDAGAARERYVAREFTAADGRASARIVDLLVGGEPRASGTPSAPPSAAPPAVPPGDRRGVVGLADGAAALVEQVERDGYVIVRGALPVAEVARAREELAALLDAELERHRCAAAGEGPAVPAGEGFLSEHQHSVYFPSLRSPRLAALAEAILDNPVIGEFLRRVVGEFFRLRVDLVRRLTGVDDRVDDFQLPHAWHRDSPGEFTFGLFFDDVTRLHSGTTIVIPGTHRLPYDPYWDMLFGGSHPIDRASWLAHDPARVGPRLTRFSVFNRWLVSGLRGAVRELSGRPGDLFFFLNATWHGRAPNAHGERNVIVRMGGFPTDFPFKDDLALPAGIDGLPPHLAARYRAGQPVNTDPGTVLRRLAAGERRRPGLADAAFLEKRVLARIARWTGIYD